MVLSSPVPRGPGASPLHCLPSCFCVSLCHFCSRFLPLLPLSVSISFFSSSFYCPRPPVSSSRGFVVEDLSGAISPLVNKCCDRRQVGGALEPDEWRETPWNASCSSVPRLIFLCGRGCLFHRCLCVWVCMSHWVCNSQIAECRELIKWNKSLMNNQMKSAQPIVCCCYGYLFLSILCALI